jgi:hypothetical protein
VPHARTESIFPTCSSSKQLALIRGVHITVLINVTYDTSVRKAPAAFKSVVNASDPQCRLPEKTISVLSIRRGLTKGLRSIGGMRRQLGRG